MSNSKGLARAAIAAVVTSAAIALVAYNAGNAQGMATSTAPIRGYYLTKNTVTGSQVLTACASGYHFASVFEILNTSDLHYNTRLGRKNVNSGLGPPADSPNSANILGIFGWIRTGSAFDPNCRNWTSSNGTDTGSSGALGAQTSPGWFIANNPQNEEIACDATIGGNQIDVGVWCVQD